MSRFFTNPRSVFVRITVVALLILLSFPAWQTSAMVRRLTFREVVAGADLVFFGQVVGQECRFGPGQKMIFTDVTFAVHEVVVHREGSEPPAPTLVLSFAGGSLEGQGFSVSDVPSFVTGEDYVVFTRWSGKQYASPVVGSTQGLFPVMEDDRTGERYPVGPGRHMITGINGGELDFGMRVRGISNGRALAAANTVPDRIHTVAPEPSGKSKNGRARARISPRPDREASSPFTLSQFLDTVRETHAVLTEESVS
jgi:hypothetical protein